MFRKLCCLIALLVCLFAFAQRRRVETAGIASTSQILGRPKDTAITLSVLAPGPVSVSYGSEPGRYQTTPALTGAGAPVEFEINDLKPDALYHYHLNQGGQSGPDYTFHTQRAPGSSFHFGVQGDSHPERQGKMFSPELYLKTMQNAAAAGLDFYVTLGDDFNVDQLYNRGTLNAGTVSQLYINQRQFLGIPARTMALFLVNGNHEQAAQCLLDGKPDSVPVLAGKARNTYYPLPAPDRFYTGDTEPVEHLGLRRDYYAWTWGDALFITLDPYWHSPVEIDEGIGGNAANRGKPRNRDGWGATMGDAQYRWLKHTLETSKAKYKFVFAHHVLGSYRGAAELTGLFEWGGRNRQGQWEFDTKRPGWELPVHQLMVKHGVTIFFQGHDHLFARQEKDGIIYQETPNPADDTYTAFNSEAYRSGNVLPNAGFLDVTVSGKSVKVDYIRAWLPQDEKDGHKNGETAFSYIVTAGKK